MMEQYLLPSALRIYSAVAEKGKEKDLKLANIRELRLNQSSNALETERRK